MKKRIAIIACLLAGIIGFSQETNDQQNRVKTPENGKDLTIGGYAQIDYNEKNGPDVGKLDVHRMVLLLNYKFNDKVSFLTEIEYEHVKEVYVEQAYLNYKAGNNINFLAGLMLVPMGIINEYHEPPTYYGVERPNVDKYIVPTTWRELGFGVSGTINDASLKYQAYIFNGFKSFEGGSGVLRGSDGLRKGRQKGAESFVSSANFSTKIDFYGIQGLRLGLSGYFGNTQTDDTTVDGSTVGVSMIGLDARYKINDVELRSQLISTSLSGTAEYNALTGKDLGSQMNGFYLELAYGFDLKGEEKLSPFVRYENYNTHAKVEGGLSSNKAYDRNEIILGLNYKVADGAAFKIDYQFADNALAGTDTSKSFNAGVAVWF